MSLINVHIVDHDTNEVIFHGSMLRPMLGDAIDIDGEFYVAHAIAHRLNQSVETLYVCAEQADAYDEEGEGSMQV